MKQKRFFLILLAILTFTAVAVGCDGKNNEPSEDETVSAKDIVILYTNDVHCGIDDNIGYAGLAAYKKQMEAGGSYVYLVDAGDAVQGGTVGVFSKGEAAIELMNQVGYDLAVPGNHAFDYHFSRFAELREMADFPYISVNFVDTEGKPILSPYIIEDFGGVKVAFLGICTPRTIADSSSSLYVDENGEMLCDFIGGADGTELYALIQNAADSARAEGADYVIAIGHLGIESQASPWTSTEVIENTSGIDAFLDGHSHSVINESVKNKDGKTVLHGQTGTKFANIGVLTISEKGITNELIGDYAEKDAETEALVNEIKSKYDASAKIAETDFDLVINQPETDPPVRIVRSAETNLGDLCADAFRIRGNADIAVINGGGVRAEIKKGDISYEDVVSIMPFENRLSVIEVTGQQLLDLLESGADCVPEESGSFYQVSGMTYEIHTYIPSGVLWGENDAFLGVEGEYRVKNVMIGGEPLDLEKTYTAAGTNYVLSDGVASGRTMLEGCKVLQDSADLLDRDVLASYLMDVLGGKVGEEYANPFGDGRIVAVFG